MDLSKIPNIILLAVSMTACLGSNVLKNYFSKKVSNTTRGCQLYNMITSIVCCFVIFAYAGFRLDGSLYTVAIGAVFGIVTAIAAICGFIAMSIGPLSYTTVMTSCSTVITAISGLFFGETIPALKWVGIALMMVCLILSNKKETTSDEKKASLKWFIFSMLAAVFCAAIGLIQKTHQESAHKSELSLLLIVAFAFSTLFSLVWYIISLKKDPPVIEKSENGKCHVKMITFLAIIFVTVGIGVALNNIINLYLVGVMDSAVFFPIVNGGHLILSTLAGLVLFKEKLSKTQWVGLASGIAATFCLCF
ncbi:MAG: hypothetical protein E7633_10800 [Ruminococcaceae bacterium]|nr:hypothetical protein [Oscillospiraceae bacterium]